MQKITNKRLFHSRPKYIVVELFLLLAVGILAFYYYDFHSKDPEQKLIDQLNGKWFPEPWASATTRNYHDRKILSAVQGLRRLPAPSPKVVPALIAALHKYHNVDSGDGIIPIRSEIAAVLGDLGDDSAIDPLISVLASDDVAPLSSAAVPVDYPRLQRSSHASVMEALAKFGRRAQKAVPYILPALQYTGYHLEYVPCNAAEALAQINAREAIPAMTAALKNYKCEVCIAKALLQFDSLPAITVAALRKVLQRRDLQNTWSQQVIEDGLLKQGSSDQTTSAVSGNTRRMATPTTLRSVFFPPGESPPENKAKGNKKNAGGSVPPIPGMEFVSIPAGEFQMGSEGPRANAKPIHPVRIRRGFELGTTEVTQGQWERVMGYNPSYSADCGKDCPVEMVGLDEVEEFIRRLNGRNDGYRYSLPTEAEWEYACRAGTTGDFPGDPVSMIRPGKHFPSARQTYPVGITKPNAWGLYDMHGNVWEWCRDWKGAYPSESVTDPAGPSTGTERIVRGGWWGHVPEPSYVRYSIRPGHRQSYLGLRLRRTRLDQVPMPSGTNE